MAALRFSTDETALLKKDELYVKSLVYNILGVQVSVDCFASLPHHTTRRFYTKLPTAKSSGSPGQFADWRSYVVWVYPPRSLYGICIDRISKEHQLKGVTIMEAFSEDLVRKKWAVDGHLPSYVQQVLQFPCYLRSFTFDSKYLQKIHLMYIVIFDKTKEQDQLEYRCLSREGECSSCKGNAYFKLRWNCFVKS